MAKRKRLTAPTADELAEMEAGFAPKPNLGAMAPIAQVAGDAAAQGSAISAEERVQAAADQKDAQAYRDAVKAGAVILDLALTEISADHMTRDRLDLNGEDIDELRVSIERHGVRLPVEVFALPDPDGDLRYGLLSGYRRLHVVRGLLAETGDPRFAAIPAVIREPADLADAMTAMVEENEIRSSLSHYERGRIAALATHQGAFDSIDQAVAALFFAASKAKRSKVRSFALIHEELGDMLTFPAALTERMGLRLANALRSGFAAELRDALATGQGTDETAEWAALEPWVVAAEQDQTDKRRRGGARAAGKPVRRVKGHTYDLGNGRSFSVEQDGQGYALRFRGPGVTADMLDAIAVEIVHLVAET